MMGLSEPGFEGLKDGWGLSEPGLEGFEGLKDGWGLP